MVLFPIHYISRFFSLVCQVNLRSIVLSFCLHLYHHENVPLFSDPVATLHSRWMTCSTAFETVFCRYPRSECQDWLLWLRAPARLWCSPAWAPWVTCSLVSPSIPVSRCAVLDHGSVEKGSFSGFLFQCFALYTTLFCKVRLLI